MCRYRPSPIGEAIVTGAKEKNLGLFEAEDFEAMTGKGIEAKVNGTKILIGNRRLMDEASILLGKLETESDQLADVGKTPMYVAANNELVGIMAFSSISVLFNALRLRSFK